MNATITRPDVGLLFQGAMVRRLLAGAKSETRRAISRHNTVGREMGEDDYRMLTKAEWAALDWSTAHTQLDLFPEAVRIGQWELMPRVTQGRRIWVRETWYCDHCFVGDVELTTNCGRVGPRVEPDLAACIELWRKELYYRADTRHGSIGELMECGDSDGRSVWRTAIHCPRWASRITLDVTEPTLPQQIGNIGTKQIAAEGFPLPASDPDGPATFHEYWDRLHGKWTPALWCWAYRGLTRLESE